MNLQQLKNIVQSSHVNFLFGSGLSRPYLPTLGDIEQWLTDIVSNKELDENLKGALETNILAFYFNGVMLPCMPNNRAGNDYNKVIAQYQRFFQHWNKIIASRHTDLLDKQVNVFTTNIDDLVEDVAEQIRVEFNAGFRGHITPIYDENAFSNVIAKVSPLFHTTASIPVFNYLKMHGSINWKATEDKNITYDRTYENLQFIQTECEKLKKQGLLWEFASIEDLVSHVTENEDKVKEHIKCYQEFLSSYYAKLVMINPRKEKFKESVLDLHFYELMRLYSNALERNNSVLFVAGFSFADEHLAQITVRAANSNPTLQVIVFAYDDHQKQIIKDNIHKGGHIINNNVVILTPTEYKDAAKEDDKESLTGLEHFDLASINHYVFTPLSNAV